MDRDHGLLVYLPLAAFAIPGLVILVTMSSAGSAVVTAVLVSYFGLVGTNRAGTGD